MDLSKMSFVDLQSLELEIKREVIHREQDLVRQAHEQIQSIAKSCGVSVEELIDGRRWKQLVKRSKTA